MKGKFNHQFQQLNTAWEYNNRCSLSPVWLNCSMFSYNEYQIFYVPYLISWYTVHVINGWLLNNKNILSYFRFRLPGVAGVLCADENGLCLAGNFYIFISINQKGILSEHYTFVYRRHIMNFNCWIPPLHKSRYVPFDVCLFDGV